MSSAELVSIAASNGVATIGALSKYAKYPFKVDENVKALDSAVSQLKAMEKDVLCVKERTDSNHIFPVSTVEDWLSKVNKATKEAEAIDQKYNHRHRFIHNFGPDYKISRDAEKKLLDVKSLIDNEIIKTLLTMDTRSPVEASPQSQGVKFDVNGKKFKFSVHAGTSN